MTKRKVIGVFCTHNNIHPTLLANSLKSIKRAKDASLSCEVDVATCSWEPIPDNPFQANAIITPFRNMGHMNYLLQMLQVLNNHGGDGYIVCILEHDMLYPEDYFDIVARNWSNNHYGLTFDNYMGMNHTGYLEVKERHQPMSLMAFAWFFAKQNMENKISECLRKDRIDAGHPYGWTCVEPDNKALLLQLPYTGYREAVHVSMEKTTKRHHFTIHNTVCYQPTSNGVTVHPYWGDYREWFPMDSLTEEGEAEAAAALSTPKPADSQVPGECLGCKQKRRTA